MRSIGGLSRPALWCFLAVILMSSVQHGTASAESQPEPPHAATMRSSPLPDQATSSSQCNEVSLLMAEGSNSCEIVSCGMGIKDTCKITCPADKTPKCSCDCLKSFGPMCTEYKANCRCE